MVFLFSTRPVSPDVLKIVISFDVFVGIMGDLDTFHCIALLLISSLPRGVNVSPSLSGICRCIDIFATLGSFNILNLKMMNMLIRVYAGNGGGRRG